MKKCNNCQNPFDITIQDKEFYRNIDVPEPDMCPQCRFQLITTYRNERTLYNNTCIQCGRDVISMYSPDKPYKVYCRECWWSNKWDPIDYGRSFDFNRPFFEQFNELRNSVPRINLLNDADSENSAYTNHVYRLKNCYLLSDACDNENCLYGNGIYLSKDCVDCSYVTQQSELCYETTFSMNCYNVRYCQDCHNCRDSAFLIDCRGCADCFMCAGLRNKKYYIKNKKYSQAEYKKAMAGFDLGNRKKIKALAGKFKEFSLTVPRKFYNGKNNENSDGDYLNNNKSVHHCFQTRNSEQCSYCFGMDESKNCYDVMVYGEQAEIVYQGQACGGQIYKILFGNVIWHGQENYYCDNCLNGAEFNFGCISLKKHKYCIFNKQYEREEFFRMREKVINHMKKTGEWGRYFPPEMSLFGYNESDANGFFPLSKEQALNAGFKWQDNLPGTFGRETLEKPPNNIKDCGKEIVKETMKCASCRRNFKYLEAEFDFYKKQGIPLPDLCPDCRYKKRIKLRPEYRLYERQCMNSGCKNKFKTSYSPERPEIVFCEDCYNKKVY